jgi:hypothetical protein
MLEYIGTKIVNAHPMTKTEYCAFRGWGVPADEDPMECGYLVEYPESPPNTATFKGYMSWSPKSVFEAAYQDINRMNFGHALFLLRLGRRVARRGWNGKGMWLTHVKDWVVTSGANVPAAYASHEFIAMRPAGELNSLIPWLASQGDMLADDWMEVK